MDEDYQMFKIVVIGSMGTGKTNISTRFIRNEYNDAQKSTVGVEFLSKIVQVRNQNIKVTLWDTAGQERYKSLSKVYYKGASGVLIVYDTTDPQSYLDVEAWMRLANENLNLNDVVLMVVGNKVDLEGDRRVPQDRPRKEYKQKFDIDCWEVSAKTGYNVKEVFNELLERIYEKNIEIKASGFDGGSDWGSYVDQSIVAPTGGVGSKNTADMKKGATGAARSSVVPIQEVKVQQEDDYANVNLNSKKNEKTNPNPINEGVSKQNKVQKNAGKSSGGVKLNAQKTKPKTGKEKTGCC